MFRQTLNSVVCHLFHCRPICTKPHTTCEAIIVNQYASKLAIGQQSALKRRAARGTKYWNQGRALQVAYWCRGFEGDMKVCYLNADLGNRLVRVIDFLPQLSSQHDIALMNIVSFLLPRSPTTCQAAGYFFRLVPPPCRHSQRRMLPSGYCRIAETSGLGKNNDGNVSKQSEIAVRLVPYDMTGVWPAKYDMNANCSYSKSLLHYTKLATFDP